MGAIMGTSVGACIGAMFGTIAILRYPETLNLCVLMLFRRGHGGNGFFPTIGKIMLQSGASFGLFMGIGSLVRCDDISDNTTIYK